MFLAFEQAGHDVYRLRDLLPADSSDRLVIAKARELNAVLVSLNGDFADIVQYPPQAYAGIVALQIRGRPEMLDGILHRVLRHFADDPDQSHYAGKLLLAEIHRIRVRT